MRRAPWAAHACARCSVAVTFSSRAASGCCVQESGWRSAAPGLGEGVVALAFLSLSPYLAVDSVFGAVWWVQGYLQCTTTSGLRIEREEHPHMLANWYISLQSMH